MALINRNLLQKTLSSEAGPILEKKIIPQLQAQFEDAKKKALSDFDQHPITREIKEGPNASNSSGTLRGIGNLYSYIGFDSGDNPIGRLRELLASKIRIRNKVARKSDFVFYITVDIPDEKEIQSVTKLPWAPGRSWASGIENGLSGLGSYLVTNSEKSRSGTAVQVEAVISNASFSTTPYLSKIIQDLIVSLEQNIVIK
jgi:hypothetical protein